MLGQHYYSLTAIAAFLVLSTSRAAAENLDEAIQTRLSGATGQLAVEGVDGWYFPTEELHHLAAGPFWGEAAASVSKAPAPDQADPLPAIVDFAQQLKAEGVHLLLVPIPPKLLVYPEKFQADAEVPSSLPLQDFYAELREQGVQVLDLLPLFSEQRKQQESDLLYCRTDSHFSGHGAIVVASAIAKTLGDMGVVPTIATNAYREKWRPVEIRGDLVPHGADAESLLLRFVGDGRAGDLVPVKTEPSSPVLLLGDSHCLVFSVGEDMHATGAGLPDQLAFALGQPIDVLGVRGSGSTPARLNLFRRVKRDPHYWSQKKVVVWCFAAREFTESPTGWRKLPVTSSR